MLENHEFLNLRALFGRVPDELFGAISRALQIINWSRSNKFCGKCGSPLVEEKKERAMICTNCDADPVYPRISPCVITLIHKENKVLLAHNVNFPDNFYSTLAGFIEPGESVEEALKREVIEEVGVEVDNISYFGSQTWPFPSQLMLGFFAETEDTDLNVDKDEIEDANWFDISQLKDLTHPDLSLIHI